MKPVLLAMATALLLTPAVYAQDGLRSASLPERPIATQPPGPDDLFRAGPDTYRPRPDRKPPGRALTNGWLYWPYADLPEPTVTRAEPRSEAGFLELHISPASASIYIDGIYEGLAGDLRLTGSRLRPGVHRVRVEATGYQTHTFDARIAGGQTVSYRRVLDPAAAEPRATPTVPAVAKTMYVIPRCYAGDRPPDPSTGCDLTKLRTIR